MMLLAGAWRRANKYPRLGAANHGDWLGQKCKGSQLHNLDYGCQGCDRRCRVHDDAELAMISVGLGLVKVRYLSYGQQRQQDKAYHCDSRQELLPGAATAGISLKSYQSTVSVQLFYSGTYQIRRFGAEGVTPKCKFDFQV